MARLSDIKADVEPAEDPTIDVEDLATEDVNFDEEDFYEAIDFLESAAKTIKGVLTHCKVSPARSHFMERLRDDILQFIEEFVEVEEDDDMPLWGRRTP